MAHCARWRRREYAARPCVNAHCASNARSASGAIEYDPAITLLETLGPAVDTFIQQHGPTQLARELRLVRDAHARSDGRPGCLQRGVCPDGLSGTHGLSCRTKNREPRCNASSDLALRLEAILRADHARSAAALQPLSLQATFGGAHRSLFDFAAMSHSSPHTAERGGLDAAASRSDRLGA